MDRNYHSWPIHFQALVLALLICFSLSGCARAEGEIAYILTPPQVPASPKTEHEFLNILLLAVDYGVYTIGDNKDSIDNCHTDSIIMVAVDKTAGRISLISIPRDTLTYVPGVYGIYKLNAAVNCAPTFKEGIESVQNTVAWLLGGIRPDHYLLVTPALVEQIGDSIGGLDINVEMRYFDTNGKLYERGMQHLDGDGIKEYARARRNATRNNNDYGRTSRQRAVLSALFSKVSADTDLAFDILDTVVENADTNFFSDLSVADLWDMLPLIEKMASGSISGYEMSGELAMSMKYFNSSYFDQTKRQEILREVYGVEIPAQRLNSHAYFNYLFSYGFDTVKAIRVSHRIIDWAHANGFTGSELTDAEEAVNAAVTALSAVDDSLDQNAALRTKRLTSSLKASVSALVRACAYPEPFSWKITEDDHWYMDPDINQYYQIDWR